MRNIKEEVNSLYGIILYYKEANFISRAAHGTLGIRQNIGLVRHEAFDVTQFMFNPNEAECCQNHYFG